MFAFSLKLLSLRLETDLDEEKEKSPGELKRDLNVGYNYSKKVKISIKTESFRDEGQIAFHFVIYWNIFIPEHVLLLILLQLFAPLVQQLQKKKKWLCKSQVKFL